MAYLGRDKRKRKVNISLDVIACDEFSKNIRKRMISDILKDNFKAKPIKESWLAKLMRKIGL